ncbi:alpha-2,8-sialyltransferase 8B-like [Convolutriloba macropyga]|uniref:alpha-2,8-sialyltransferase 8B-like n=1 Tax=Convolutriloba macropyga TaxID=536237 RepID=UPI003F527759
MKSNAKKVSKESGGLLLWQQGLLLLIFGASAVKWWDYLMYHPEPAALERHHGTASASTPDHDSPLHLDRSPPNLLKATSSPALGPVAPYPTDKQNVTGKQHFFFPSTIHSRWRMALLDLGEVHFLLHSAQFYTDGTPGNASSGLRASLTYPLWSKTANGDGANFHGMAAQLAVEQGIGMYKFPPEMLDHLPATAPTLHYRTCAVIGNSGELLQGQLGVEIDSHDAVIRLNAAPTKGYETYVGNKTTYGFINHAHFKKLATGDATKAKAFAEDKGRLVLFESTIYQAYFRLYMSLVERFPPQLLHMVIVSPDFTSAAFELWRRMTLLIGKEVQASYKHKKPTSGWFAMVFAAEMCDTIDLYGFEAYKRTSNAPARYHYFDNVQGFTNVHSFELTVQVFQRLQSMGFNLRLAHPIHGIHDNKAS